MTEYRVIWTVDVDAKSPEEAARLALAMQRDRSSIALVFEVTPKGASSGLEVIDLLGTSQYGEGAATALPVQMARTNADHVFACLREHQSSGIGDFETAEPEEQQNGAYAIGVHDNDMGFDFTVEVVPSADWAP
jgi:flavin-binding protein dodecin